MKFESNFFKEINQYYTYKRAIYVTNVRIVKIRKRCNLDVLQSVCIKRRYEPDMCDSALFHFFFFALREI